MMKMKITYILIAVAVMMSACSKKLDYSYDNRMVQYPMSASGIRVVNLVGATELSVNGQRLTSYLQPDKEGYYGPNETRGTAYFPETGRLGLTYSIPREQVKASGWVDSILFSSLSVKNAVPAPRPFRAKEDDAHPNDYYFVRFRPNPDGFQDSLFVIPRGISPAADPAVFKVRLLNLSSTITGSIPPGIFRTGPMSLTLADGTGVPGLSNIAPGKYSDYVEIPYGTYQFKVLNNEGKEVPAGGTIYNLFNPATGTLMDINGTPGIGGNKDTWLTYAPLKTFQPGGIYTIVVSSTYEANIPTGNPNGETYKSENNTFRIIADIPEPLNITYARLQGVNVAAGKKITWQVDGQPMGSTLAFTQQTTYSRYITGTHMVKALDENGQVLAESNLAMQPADNFTAWLYTRKDGSAAITFSANNLSGKYYDGTATDDGTYSILKAVYPFWIRFMNFCPDLEEVTFTQGNGQPFSAVSALAYQHIYFAKAVTDLPYVMQMVNFSQPVMAYASRPGIAPGDWLRNITPLKSRDFIARPELYKTPELPQSEPGIYTVVLLGSTAANATEKARMIIVKHNN
ncbi:hypothetical protein SAMN05660461_2806 [Chitinophaga ginsengisegetis]|uniref:DUF4397 domain-containing protein n=2 Tax=Chitinophaga ginsengisegetis TaxID=393003 RepID=A0A1T5NUW2_9BACT|nr:hypothetical protein SAMN05660461_2806 [Chitinophaga ginsengisegetis]